MDATGSETESDWRTETEESEVDDENKENETDAATNPGGTNRTKKTGKYLNGYTLFYQAISESLVQQATDMKHTAPSITEMSKIGAKEWRKLDRVSRKDWNRKAQLEREEHDCQQKELKCGNCGKVFQSGKRMRYHEKQCGDSVCFIEGCGKTFSNKELLKKHSKTHEETHVCPKCNKAFGIKHNLVTHMQGHEKSFECEVCGKKFGTKGNMNRHKNNIHS